MKLNRLATALSITCLCAPVAMAAKYRVVELPLQDKAKYTFSAAINDSGDMLAHGQLPFNPPIDTSLVNFEDEALVNSLTDPGAAENGIFNADDLVLLYNYVKSGADNALSQQLADYQSYVFDSQEINVVHGIDVYDSELESHTQSVDIFARDINNSGGIVGNSPDPYQKVEYQNESGDEFTFVVHGFNQRGFLSLNNQTTIAVIPPEDTLGGVSQANGINNSFEVAGMASIGISETLQAAVDDCENDEQRGDSPVELCINNLLKTNTDAGFVRRGMIWQYDANGNLIDERELGMLVTPDTETNTVLTSRAVAINNNGVAVGTSHDYYQGDESRPLVFAAIFDGNEVKGITDHSEYYTSYATDINDQNVVVGYALKILSGGERSKFFVHDMQGESTIYPDDFFESSSSIARAINNEGLVVGDGEVDSNLTGSRRRAGFIYDINNDTFENINTLIGCDSSYDIVQANDINDNGEIAATAVVYRERMNIAGELDLDDRGNTIEEGMTVAVKLIPIPGGDVDECQQNDVKYERKGGTLSLLGLLLLPVVAWRRRLR
ncbi:DUF3466 family protein [Aestuariibacter halophilus]|uniref:DUF3466 family protein n=1 Tax=Fluctibacter halophilus TaxID=226011 RepID=A0ABS8G6H1_9ALTE|nr:DUF3466 family protein [Aestuariibacter halophilus]MCC2615681.1 DUF3466 family protein [Aestuariibacter halophilus]